MRRAQWLRNVEVETVELLENPNYLLQLGATLSFKALHWVTHVTPS